MEVTCGYSRLNRALSQVSRLVPTRTELPILSNLLLRATKSSLILQATNLQLSISAEVPAEIKEEGEITVPAVPVQNFISTLSGEKVDIKLEQNRLQIKSGETRGSFVTMDAVDYPTYPQRENQPILKFSAEELARLIRKAVFAAAVEESRPVLTGVLIQLVDEKVAFVATDGFRLSKVVGEASEVSETTHGMIVPASAFSEVEKLLGSSGEKEVRVFLSEDKNQVVFDFVSVQLASRLLEAQYPDYEKILPADFEVKVQLPKRELEQAVQTASVFAQRDGQTVFLTFKPKELVVEAESAEVGELVRKLPIELAGDGLKVAFNAGFLQEGLAALDGDEVVFETKDAESPSRWFSPDDTGFFHIVMPIRLDEDE